LPYSPPSAKSIFSTLTIRLLIIVTKNIFPVKYCFSEVGVFIL
jgi:hypothetical protein